MRDCEDDLRLFGSLKSPAVAPSLRGHSHLTPEAQETRAGQPPIMPQEAASSGQARVQAEARHQLLMAEQVQHQLPMAEQVQQQGLMPAGPPRQGPMLQGLQLQDRMQPGLQQQDLMSAGRQQQDLMPRRLQERQAQALQWAGVVDAAQWCHPG